MLHETIPSTIGKAATTAVVVVASGAATVWGGFNEWAGEYSPAITTLFGLVAMLTGIGTLFYKFWSTRVSRRQQIGWRKLHHRELDVREREARLKRHERGPDDYEQ